MTLLQIHVGELSPQRQSCFDSARIMYPDFDVLRIDERNIDEYIGRLRTFYSLGETPDMWNPKKLRSLVWLSDNLRFMLLAENKNMLYADSDVLHLKRFEFDHAAKVPYLMGVPADTAMMYSADACKYFRDICLRCQLDKWYGNPMVYVNGGDGIPIMRDYYEHYGAGEWSRKATDIHWWM